jgi:hypothetical protein
LSFPLIKETRARETQRASGSNRTIVGLRARNLTSMVVKIIDPDPNEAGRGGDGWLESGLVSIFGKSLIQSIN